ncbi:MAG: peptide deformylase [Patescibacteria group bacterium]|nr:MAG: peptide deformylase [Patescibacteria group bacterium]
MPKPFKILKAPDKRLTTPVKPVTKFDAKLKKIAQRMIATLDVQTDPPGVGLAANQVGLDLAMFVVKKHKNDTPLVVINPQILAKGQLIDNLEDSASCSLEGCLSIPKIWSPVDRYDWVKIKFQDLDGRTIIKKFKALDSVIVQHEIDHLNGILFTKRVIEQNKNLYKEVGNKFVKIDL